MSVFSGKTRISRIGGGYVAEDSTILDVSAVRGSASKEDVSQEEFRETIDSGLFTFQDELTVRWAHGAFAAFLAAEWCDKLGLSLRDLTHLLTAIHGNERGVPDQIRFAAGWSCELRPALQKTMLRHSPLLLLSLDSNAIAASIKPDAIRAVIAYSFSPDGSQQISRAGSHFNYTGIAAQIRPYIRSKRRRPLDQRLHAMDLAIACRLVDLSKDLAEQALDQSEPLVLRHRAAFAISEFGDKEARRALLPLSQRDEVGDSQELKGWALAANWPGMISSHDIFSLLGPKTDPHFHVGYETFLIQFAASIGETFTDEDLVHAFAWANQIPVHDNNLAFDRVIQSIIVRACDSYSDPVIRRLLAELLVNRVRAHGDAVPRETFPRGSTKWDSKLAQYPEFRPLLIRECLDVIATPDRIVLFRMGQFLRLSPEDIPLLGELAIDGSRRYGPMVAELLTMVRPGPTVYDAIFDGIRQGYFDPRFQEYLKTDIGSPAAEMEKDNYERPMLLEAARERRLREGWNAFHAGLAAAQNEPVNGWAQVWESLWTVNPEKDSPWEGSPNLDRAPG